MNKDDKETFEKGRPFLMGIIALLYSITKPTWDRETCFDQAEKFIKEFEKRS